jgi:hypothetical protein
MAVSAARVREMVSALDGTHEGAHHGHPDFRVRNKIFATLNETEERVALRLSAAEGRALAAAHPGRFRLVADREPIAWVSGGLETLEPTELADVLEEAWSLRVSEQRSGRRRP